MAWSSTIVDCTEEVPVILRPGYINQEMIEKIVGRVKMDKGLLITDETVKPKPRDEIPALCP